MKNSSMIFLLVLGTTGVFAQEPPNVHQEKMKVFADWVGRWQGEGSMQMGPGEPQRSRVDERIESKLDGTILTVEGVGKSIDKTTGKEVVVHQAFAVLSYDPTSNEYKFRTHLSDGRSTDAWLKVNSKNNFQWGFETPRGKVRYNIAMDEAGKTWTETGEFSPDGNSWMKFFDMTLKKVE